MCVDVRVRVLVCVCESEREGPREEVAIVRDVAGGSVNSSLSEWFQTSVAADLSFEADHRQSKSKKIERKKSLKSLKF